MKSWVQRGTVLAVGAFVALLAITGSAHAQYPPPTGSVSLSADQGTVALGDSAVLSVGVIGPDGLAVEGASCTFAVTDQPGTDATVDAGPFITDANGIAQTTLSVGSADGVIAVEAQCGELSALTSVVAGEGTGAEGDATGLPSTGDGTLAGGGGSFPWMAVILGAIGLAMIVAGARGIVASRRSR